MEFYFVEKITLIKMVVQLCLSDVACRNTPTGQEEWV